MKLLKDSLTGIDGESFSGPKVAGFLVVFTYLALSVADFIARRTFDPQAFGIGAGAAVGAMGVAIKLAETSEPKP